MKKLLLLIFLMTISLGQSQTTLLGFESGESGYALANFGDMALPLKETGTGTNTSSVLKVVANPTGQIWQGCNFVLTRPVELIATKSMTIDVLSSQPVTFLMKVNTGVAGAPEAAAQASHDGDGTWQTITFTFNTALDGKAATANGVYKNMVIHPFFPFSGSASARTFYIDNISGPLAKVAPTLSNFSISAKTVGNSFELTAPTTNSDGAFTYTSSNEAIATISGSTVSVIGAGNVTITATQATGTYNTGGSITATFTASSLAIPTIGTLTVPTKIVGDNNFNLTAPTSNSAGAFTYTSSNIGVATISGSTVTIVGVGTSTITASQAATSSYEAGSVTATLTVSLPNATTPTNDAADVISIFSGAYTDLANTNFFPNWGQSTKYVQENGMLKYSSLNYQGITFSPKIDATSMEKLHIDIWTPDCTSFQMFVLDGSDEQKVTLTPSLSGWNSYDISLSQYTLLTKSNILEFKIVGNGTVYLDNIYFWKVPAGTNTYYADTDGDGYGAGAVFLSTATTAPTGYSVNNTDCNDTSAAAYPGATEIADALDNDCDGKIDEGFPPSIAAPTPPARNAWDVKSIFSGAYSNVTIDQLPTSWSQTAIAPFSVETIAGNATWKFGGEFLGMEISNPGVDLTDMTMMHIDYWTPDTNLILLKIVNTVNVGDAITIVEDPTTSGSWRSRDIAMTTFGGSINKSKITQLLIDPQSGGSTVYIDNLYFYRPETGAPSPTISAFSVPTKVVGDTSFDLTAPTSNSTGAFTYTSSNESVATISGSTVTIVGAGTSTITATQAAAGSYGAGSTQATLVVSLNVAASTPTIAADRVLSVYSGATGYGTLAGTTFNPNWGQATQYAQVDVVGNPTLRYSNLNYQGIQLGSILDITTYDSIHLDIYGAGTPSVDFTVINQAGGAGSSDVERLAKTAAIALNPGWNSVVIPVASLLSINPDFELNRVGQFKFDGSGTIYVDNIYFSKSTPSHTTAPTVADITYCKGAIASTLTATAIGTNTLKWYSTAIIKTALTAAPKPVTTLSGTKKFYVAQVMSDGVVSPRAEITVTVLDLPTEVLGAITSTTEVDATPGTYVAAVKAVGPYVGSQTTVSYRVPAFTGSDLTYFWTVPAGVSIVGQASGVTSVTQEGVNANILNVNFKNVSSGIVALGSITVQAKNASGCLTTSKASVALTKALPTAPVIKMTDALLTVPVSGIPTAVTSFARYMGTTRELTLTATAASANYYIWELPTGVNITNNSATTVDGVTSSTSNVITVNFNGVTKDNTHNYSTTALVPVSTNVLRIGVKAVNGVGISTTANTALANSSLDFYPNTTSTAKLLTLTAIVPAAPAALVMRNADGNTPTTNITAVGPFIGTSTVLTLTATLNAAASSYSWTLPEGVNQLSGGNSNVITVNFADVASGTTSLPISVNSVNGCGTSVLAKTLTLTRALPATPGVITASTANVCSVVGTPTNVTYTVAPVAGAFENGYIWTVPTGASIVGSATGNSISVSYTTNYTTAGAVTVKASNGVGSSATAKTLAVTRVAPVAIASISGGTTYSTCDQTFSTTSVANQTYTWTVPVGATIKSGQGTNSVVVNYGSLKGSQTIKVITTNACGLSSAVKSLTLTSGSCPVVSFTRVMQTANVSVSGMYPNPTTDSFNLELSATESAEVSVTVYSFDGIVVSSKNVQLSEGSNVLNEDLSSQRNGIYFVKIIDSTTGLETIKKIIKQ